MYAQAGNVYDLSCQLLSCLLGLFMLAFSMLLWIDYKPTSRVVSQTSSVLPRPCRRSWIPTAVVEERGDQEKHDHCYQQANNQLPSGEQHQNNIIMRAYVQNTFENMISEVEMVGLLGFKCHQSLTLTWILSSWTQTYWSDLILWNCR